MDSADSRSVRAALNSRLKPCYVTLRLLPEEWRSLQSWAASHDAVPSTLLTALVRTWQRRKYPIEWTARPLGSADGD